MKQTMIVLCVCGLLPLMAGCGGDDEESDASSNTVAATSNGSDIDAGSTSSGDTTASTDAGDTSGGGASTDTGEATADTGAGDEDTTAPEDGGAQVAFTEVFAALDAQGCTNGYCHGGGVGGLILNDQAPVRDNLVGVEASTSVCGLTQLVVPGEPEQSILWMRIRPEAQGDGCAPKMPPQSGGIDEDAAQLIYDWIASGAGE